MEIQLGNLTILPALKHLDMLSERTAVAIQSLADSEQIGVAEIDPQFSDTASFCKEYGVTPEQCANCVIIEAKRGENKEFAACIILASTRADVNGLARRTLDARKASFASMDQAVSETSMEYGAITPIGLPAEWRILVDSKVIETDYVIIGSGIRKSKLVIPGKVLVQIPNVTVLEGLGNPISQ